MDYNFVTNIQECPIIISNMLNNNFSLLYYSHIPTAVIALIITISVFLKNKKSLAGKILFALAVAFSLWLFFDLILWKSADSGMIMFFWSLLGILDGLFFILSLYFVYVFIDEEDVSFIKKIIFSLLLLPIILLTPTALNLSGFVLVDCEGVENPIMLNYLFALEIFTMIWIIILSISRYTKANSEMRKKIMFLLAGIIFFLGTFFVAGYVADALVDVVFGSFKFEFYGFFGMTFFMGVLAFMIVKFKAFDIKLLGAQALIVAQFVMIAAMFTFASSTTNRILISITLLGTALMGWFLIRSSKKLDERKEQLQLMAGKLAQSNDKLRTLDNSKSEFISIASHQLRTPLTAIKGFISMLLEGSYGKLIPAQEDILNKVYTSNERLVTLVEDLLNVSRMESGRMEFKFTNWKMETICQDVIDTFMMRAKEHDLTLEYNKPETALPELFIDGVKVREVISNLVDNAIKYTLEGHGGVKVKLEQLGENIRVTIADTGIGIPATELPYLFAKFSRGKDIGRLNTGGTGLGLYVGKSMIENNGGRIWAESDGQNLGSRFIIELPIRQSEELIKRWG